MCPTRRRVALPWKRHRAMAYVKLERFAEAAADCSEVLQARGSESARAHASWRGRCLVFAPLLAGQAVVCASSQMASPSRPMPPCHQRRHAVLAPVPAQIPVLGSRLSVVTRAPLLVSWNSQRDARNVKALLRRAAAALGLARPGEAAADAREVLKLQPGNKEATEMLRRLGPASDEAQQLTA